MPPRALRVVLWSTVILFSLLGIVSVISRGVLLTTAASENLSDVEKQVLEMMYGHSPRKLEALEEAPKITGRYVRHRLLAMLHIIPGGLFLAFAPLQFSSKFRNRHLDFHRRTAKRSSPFEEETLLSIVNG
ncbi:MAG: hypothetical protein ACXW2X_06835 [Thermoanaerobaculia bacterium]